MWLDVIRDGRRLDAARFEAYAAQRLDAELVTATMLPARSINDELQDGAAFVLSAFSEL
jgi:hypothetical protein